MMFHRNAILLFVATANFATANEPKRHLPKSQEHSKSGASNLISEDEQDKYGTLDALASSGRDDPHPIPNAWDKVTEEAVAISSVMPGEVEEQTPPEGSGHQSINQVDQIFQVAPEQIQKFKSEHGLRKDANLNFLTISEENKVTLHGRDYPLGNLEPMNVYAEDAAYVLDGHAKLHPPVTASLIFTGNEGGDTVMVMKDEDGHVRTMDVMGADGSAEYLAAVSPGILALITPHDLDPKSMKKVTFGDMAGIQEDDKEGPSNRALAQSLPRGRYLRHGHGLANDGVGEGDSGGRALQSGCSSFRVIEVATAYDSTFCSMQGGATATRREVEQIVARASLMYQQQGVCTKLVISHMEGFCTASTDPYRSGVNSGNIGCDQGRYGLLDAFEAFWRNNRQSVRRDAAHLFYARDYPESPVGCASVATLCDNNNAFGVNEMAFDSDQNRRTIVFAHELGHNIGLTHVQSTNSNRYIMDGVGFGTHIWSPQSLNTLASRLSAHSCISTESGTGGGGCSNGLVFRSQADSSMCIDLKGADTTNTNDIWLFPCNGTPAQQWLTCSDGTIRSALNSNKCLVGSGGATTAGTKLMIHDCFANDSRFEFYRYTDNTIRPGDNTGQCFDVSGERLQFGSTSYPKIQLYDCNGGADKYWYW